MIRNNEFTAEDQRFFHPENGPIEYHHSFDVDCYPIVINAIGDNQEDNYVVVETAGGEERAHRLERNSNLLLPAGAEILQVRALAKGALRDRSGWGSTKLLSGAEVALYLNDSPNVYDPHAVPGALAVVELKNYIRDGFDDPRFDDRQVALIPVEERLPEIPDEQLRGDMPVRYKLHGFIETETDRLVVHTRPDDYDTLLVDWSVVNFIKQNSLEEALLQNAIPFGMSLAGSLELEQHTAPRQYLQYYDKKHDTHFMPEYEDQRPTSMFGPMSDEQRARYRQLINQARERRSVEVVKG